MKREESLEGMTKSEVEADSISQSNEISQEKVETLNTMVMKDHHTILDEFTDKRSTSTPYKLLILAKVAEFSRLDTRLQHKDGGIVENPRQRKLIASAFENSPKSKFACALDVNRSNINEEGDYCLDSKRIPTVNVKIEGRATTFDFESRVNSNFPLGSFTRDHLAESALKGTNEKLEPDFHDESPSPGPERHLTQASSVQRFSKNRRSTNVVASLNSNALTSQDNHLAKETLVIGGLVKRKSHMMIRNKSALSKEYH